MNRDLQRAIKVARKKIRILSAKALESNLDAFCGTFGEAYTQGVEEAQGEIISRLLELAAKSDGEKHGS
jgi:hypothetical protein